MKLCRIGFCGAGKWVKNHHIPELQKKKDRFEIVGFYDVSKDKSAELMEYKAYDTLEELADDPEVDVVIVASKPTATHLAATLTLLEKGKSVILEKPMACTSGECDQLIAKAREKKVLFTVHQNLRCCIGSKATLEVMRRKDVGEPVYLEINRPCSWYDHQDFGNQAIHIVDQALALNRSPLREVSAMFVHPEEPMNSCGYGDALLRFEQPPAIRISMRPLVLKQPESGEGPDYLRMYLCGTKDTFALARTHYIPYPEELLNNQHHYFDNSPPDFSRPEFTESLGKDYFDFFYESWSEGAPLLVTPEEARNAVRCIELMLDSARLNRTVPASDMLPGREDFIL